jgi:hypothetical protein
VLFCLASKHGALAAKPARLLAAPARLPLSFPWPASWLLGSRFPFPGRPVLAPAKAGVGVPKPRGLFRCHGASSDKREIRSRAVTGRASGRRHMRRPPGDAFCFCHVCTLTQICEESSRPRMLLSPGCGGVAADSAAAPSAR